MKAVSGGNGEFWGWKWEHKRRRIKQSKASKSSDSATGGGGGGYWFPLKQAVTAGALALTGDTVAQVTDRWKKNKPSKRHSYDQDASQNSNDNQVSVCVFSFIYYYYYYFLPFIGNEFKHVVMFVDLFSSKFE